MTDERLTNEAAPSTDEGEARWERTSTGNGVSWWSHDGRYWGVVPVSLEAAIRAPLVMPRDLRPTVVKYYIGERDGHRVTVLVPGHVDADGQERIAAGEARRVEHILDGGDYTELPYITEPTCSTHSSGFRMYTRSTSHQLAPLVAVS